ncbi:MAG: zinc ribbon domain-containing protein, partial [Ilumatobacteraceae bacterium]
MTDIAPTTPVPDAFGLPGRILPVDDDRDTGGFFQAAHDRRLVVKSCRSCGAVLHLPRDYCYHCDSWDT